MCVARVPAKRMNIREHMQQRQKKIFFQLDIYKYFTTDYTQKPAHVLGQSELIDPNSK